MLRRIKISFTKRVTEEPLFFAVNLGIVFFVVGFIFLGWFLVAESIQKKATSNYILELVKVRSLSKEEYLKRVEKNFGEWNHPYFRSLWGLMLLEEKQKLGKFEEKIDIAQRVMVIRGVPKPVKDGLLVYTTQLKFSAGKNGEVEQIANQNIVKNTFAPLMMEVKFLSLLRDNKKEEANKVYDEIMKTDSGVNDRVSELLYISNYQPYILANGKH